MCVCLISLLDHLSKEIRLRGACKNPGDMDKDVQGAEKMMDTEGDADQESK